ncbi:MAG: hypothetical protein GY913_32890 [Proteobacteria bacterium]|nr:hypothetical protein [Pseudomonadota bacterium]MCP4921721.1 hypothetical protein [Pseudomonadota bacterium]
MSNLKLVHELIRLTELQVEAARNLDGDRLTQLNGQRADRTFELHVQLQEGIADDERDALAEQVGVLRAMEIRLEKVAGAVSDVLDAARPPRRVATYGRRGRMG